MPVSFQNPVYHSDSQYIGDHIKARRKKLGLLQKDVATLLSVSEDTIAGWENKRTQPMVHCFPAIIKFLGYDPSGNDNTSISEQIRKYRQRNGLSHKKLGKLIGIDGSTVGCLESESSSPNKDTRKKLKRFFGTKLENKK